MRKKKVRSPQARDSQTFHGEETCTKGSIAAQGRAELSTVLGRVASCPITPPNAGRPGPTSALVIQSVAKNLVLQHPSNTFTKHPKPLLCHFSLRSK